MNQVEQKQAAKRFVERWQAEEDLSQNVQLEIIAKEEICLQ